MTARGLVQTLKRVLLGAALACGLLLAVVAALLVWPLAKPPTNSVAGDWLISNATIVDVETGTLQPAQDVVIRDGRIQAIGQTGSLASDPSLKSIDGSGKYLLPGLWDMHAHSLKISPHYHHPLYLANGVTGLRDMSGCMSEPDSFLVCIDDRQRWNQGLLEHNALSPRYIRQSSFQINGGSEVPKGYPDFLRARDKLEARELARFYHQAGADSLKVYSEILPEPYLALADEAAKLGLTLEGHRPVRVSLSELIAAGQRSIEHPRLFLFECYEQAEAFRAQPNMRWSSDPVVRQSIVDRHDAVHCDQQINYLAASDTWWVPTMQVLRMSAMAADPEFRADPRLVYIPWLIRRTWWAPDANRAANHIEQDGRNTYAQMYALALRHVAKAHAAGAKILAGTDPGDTYIFPGFSIHDELRELVRAGLSPADALATATIEAARFSGVAEQFGSIKTGKVGDLLLLTANPLADITNTERIEGMIFNGQYFSRDSLKQLLVYAENQANSVRLNLHLIWQMIRSPIVRVQVAD